MVWDVLNALLGFAEYEISALISALPVSPIYVTNGMLAAVAVPLQYAAWWFPVNGMAVVLAAWIVVVIAWVTFLSIRQFVEAVTP